MALPLRIAPFALRELGGRTGARAVCAERARQLVDRPGADAIEQGQACYKETLT